MGRQAQVMTTAEALAAVERADSYLAGKIQWDVREAFAVLSALATEVEVQRANAIEHSSQAMNQQNRADDLLALCERLEAVASLLDRRGYVADRDTALEAALALRRDAPREGASVDDAMVEAAYITKLHPRDATNKTTLGDLLDYRDPRTSKAIIRAALTAALAAAALADRAPREDGEART